MQQNNFLMMEREDIETVEENAGIYALINKENEMMYVGQTKNLRNRFIQHLNQLRKGNHSNEPLLRDYFLQKKDNFFIKVLEILNCKNCSESEIKKRLNEREEYWMMQTPSEKSYNLSKFRFKDDIIRYYFKAFQTGDEIEKIKILLEVIEKKNEPVSSIYFQEFGLEYKQLMRYLEFIIYIYDKSGISFTYTDDVIIIQMTNRKI